MFKDKNVVVTGGSGFLGTHFMSELLSRGAKVKTSIHKNSLQIKDERIEVVENIDLTKLDDAMKLIDGADYVIHLSGYIGHPSDIATDFQIALNQINVITNELEASSHVVPALIKRVLSGEDPFVVWGSPDVVRDFLYVKDVVKGCLLVLEKGESMRPYNVGYGSTITIGDIVDVILKVTEKTPKVEWDNSKPTTIPFRMVSTERITNELGFKPDYTFEDGMRETVEWYLENNK
jgi:nucleoside-diphosphate-sugar epimerase